MGDYRHGDPLVICDMSGWKFHMSETVRTWNGLRVAKRFVGEETTRHPQDLVTGRADRQIVPDGRPEPADSFLDTNEVTPESL